MEIELGKRLIALPSFRWAVGMRESTGERIIAMMNTHVWLSDPDDPNVVFRTSIDALTHPDMDDEATLWLVMAQIVRARSGVGMSMLHADRIFLRMLLANGVRRWKAHLVYWAVRIGGWTQWK